MSVVHLIALGTPVGVAILINSRRVLSSPRASAIIFVTAAVVAAVPLLLAPSRRQREQRLNRMFAADVASIEHVSIAPYFDSDDPRSSLNLVPERVVVRDRARIQALADALKTAEAFSPRHHGIQWSAVVTFRDGDGDVTFTVSKTVSDKNGVHVRAACAFLISVTARCDECGGVLEEMVGLE